MRIAITGGAGFIGSKLANLLRGQGHEIVVIDVEKPQQEEVEWHKVDIQNKEQLIEALNNVDAIYHLAAAHRDDIFPRSIYYDVNVTGTQNLVDAADHHKIKTIIFTGTVAVYGLDAGNSKETDTPSPFNEYGQSKLEAEEVLKRWATGTKDATLVLTRLVATFGPGNRGNVHTLIDQISKGRFLMIGSGKNAKSVAFIDNVVTFLATMLKAEKGIHLYNYADKPDMTMIDMVGTIRQGFGKKGSGIRVPYYAGLAGGYVFDVVSKVTGKTFPISVIRIRKFCANTIVCADKIHHTLDYKPRFTLEEGLKKTIQKDFSH
mgnify:CR=1 FL=1